MCNAKINRLEEIVRCHEATTSGKTSRVLYVPWCIITTIPEALTETRTVPLMSLYHSYRRWRDAGTDPDNVQPAYRHIRSESAGLKQRVAIGTPEVPRGLVGVPRAVSRFLIPSYPGSFRPYELR
jgi:hypothetical protein